MADNTGKYNPSLLRLTSTTPNSISHTKISHKSSLNQKRTSKTNAQIKRSHTTSCSWKRTLKTHATRNGHRKRMLKNQSQNLMQLKTNAENECSNNKQSQNLKLRRSKKLRQSQKLNLLLPLQKLIQSQKLKLLQPLQKLVVTKAYTAVTKAHPLRSHVFLQQCYVFRGIHEYIRSYVFWVKRTLSFFINGHR